MASNRFAYTITKEEINKLPLKQFEGKIKLIDTISELKKAADVLNNQSLLGFDTETKPSFKKNKKNKVSLLQLSTSKVAYLFRLNIIGFNEELISILNNENIIKVGTALKDDIRALKVLNSFNPAGFVDLQEYSNEHGINVNALKSLTAIVLGFRISKTQQISNWENDILKESQLKYAATDAWVCHEIYKKLNHF